MALKKSCEKYLSEPHKVHLYMLLNALKKDTHPSYYLLNKIMIFSMLQHDTYLENWFLQCVKKLIENPNTTFSCPEDYEDIFDNDDASVS